MSVVYLFRAETTRVEIMHLSVFDVGGTERDAGETQKST